MANQKEGNYRIIIRNEAKKNLLKIPMPWQVRIARAIEVLRLNPFYGEKMWGEFANCRKIRVWPYRIIYEVFESKKMIYVRRIDHRGSIGYK